MSDPTESESRIEFMPGAVKAAMAGCKSSDLWKVPLSKLRIVEGFNVRMKNEAYVARVRQIADSIKENGFYADKPLAGYVAREDGVDYIVITDGHRRFEALNLAISEGAQITEAPVVTKPNGTSMEDLTVALVTSNESEPLTPYEVAIACKRLVNFGMGEAEIARRLSVSVTHVQNLLSLMAAPRNVRDMVACGKVSATLAIETLRKHGKEAEQVLSGAITAASAAGKDRVTKKQLGQDGAAGRGPRFSKALMARSVSWVVENKLEEDARILGLLAYLGGMDADGVRKLITTPQEPAADSGEQAAGQSADAGDAGAGTDNTDQV